MQSKAVFTKIRHLEQNIIIQSLQKGISPDNMKIAKVIFVYKREDPCHFANYRPISLLSNMTDFFERDRKSTRLNSSHMSESRMPSSA